MNWKIQIIGVTVPDFHKQGEQVYFDLDQDTSIKLTKQSGAVSDLNEFKVDKALSNSMPHTPKNYLICSPKINPNVLDQDFSGFDVVVSCGSIVLPQTKLFITDYNTRIEFELRYASDHWTTAAAATFLKDLELGEYEITNQHTVATWSQTQYDPDSALDIPYQIPPINYGKFLFGDGRIISPDLRPLNYALAVLQIGFCAIGYEFVCPVLEGTVGRRILTYILKEDYGTDEDEKERRKFKAIWDETTLTDDDNNLVFAFPTEVYDVGGFYDSGYYSGPGVHDFVFTGKLRIDLNINTPELIVLFEMVVDTSYGTEYIAASIQKTWVYNANNVDDEGNVYIPIELKAEDLYIGVGERVYIRYTELTSDALGGDSIEEIYYDLEFYNVVKSTFFTYGDTVNVAEQVDQQLTLLDYLKGVTHWFNPRFVEDPINKTVTFYPLHPSTWFDEDFDGYYQASPTVRNLTTIQKTDSESVELPTKKNERYVELKFKNASGVKNKEVKEESGLEPFSRKIDLGEEYLNKTKKLENPLFEPTINDEIEVLSNSGFVAIDMPFMLDNDQGKQSLKIKPQMVIYHGIFQGVKLVRQDGTEIDSNFLLDGGQQNYFPYSAQKPNAVKSDNSTFEHLTYGEMSNDFYNSFFQFHIQRSLKQVGVTLLAYLNSVQYRSWTPRDFYFFTVNGRTVGGRLLEIEYEPTSSAPAKFSLIPDKQTSACLEPEVAIICSNAPELVVNYVGGCYYFSTAGTFQETPTVTIDYRYLSDDEWTEAIELCDPTESFVVRARFAYETCPQQTLKRSYSACENNPAMSFLYDYDAGEVTISIGGINSSVLDSSSEIVYSVDGGGDVTVAGTSVTVSITEEVCASGTAVYAGVCDDVPVPESCFNVSTGSYCDQNTPSVQCVYDGGGVTLEKTGTLVNDALLDEIQYREVGNTEWLSYPDGYTLACPIEARRIVIFCADACPSICSNIVTCGCPGCAETNLQLTDFNCLELASTGDLELN